jgi:ABC-type antimicrobial peptide transport system permease subunit
MLVANFAALAPALAAVGIYGVVTYVVTERTREVGIRIALGAVGRDVLRFVLRDGLRRVVVGLAAGVVVALAAVRLMRSLLFEIAPADPLSFIVAPLVLFAVAAAAALLPARRATRIDPIVALRED